MTSDDFKNTAKDIADKVSRSSHETSDSLSGTTQDLKGSAKETASQAGARLKGVADQVSGTASDLYDRASESVGRAAGSLPGSASDAMAKGQRTVENSGNQVAGRVKQQPLEAILLAAAVGYLVGWATNRG